MIPASRLYDWTAGKYIGIPGGIPNLPVYQTLHGLNDKNEVDVSPQIWEALTSCPEGKAVVLPETEVGFRIDDGFRPNNGTALRGAGRDKTKLLYHGIGGGNRVLGISSGQTEPGINGDYSGGAAILYGKQGEFQIEVADATGISPGDILTISENNDYSIPFVQPSGGQERLRRQKSSVASVSGKIVTLTEPLMWTLTSALKPTARRMTYSGMKSFWGVGFEDFTLDCSPYGGNFNNGAFGALQAIGCWLKNVYIKAGGANAAIMDDCYRCEIQGYKCDQTGTSAGHTGMIIQRSQGMLVTDSEFGAMLELNFGTSGSFSFNHFRCGDAGSFVGISIDGNHGGGNQYCLTEGNWLDKWIDDAYHGSGYGHTLLRNVIRGQNETASEWRWAVGLFRFARDNNVLGNIIGRGFDWDRYDNDDKGKPDITYATRSIYMLGLPNMGGPGYVGIAPPWSEGMPPAGLAWPGNGAYQQIDTGVRASLIRKGNWNGYHKGIPAEEAIAPEELPISLTYPDGPPSWWPTGKAWPPYSPFRPEEDGPERIPAGQRFMTGSGPAVPPPVVVEPPPVEPPPVVVEPEPPVEPPVPPPAGDPPVITVWPQSQTAKKKANVTFTVSAAGAPTLRYQWYQFGTAIPGATGPSITLQRVNPGFSGEYSVTVSNDFGSELARAALRVR